jgi:hypothetical protein
MIINQMLDNGIRVCYQFWGVLIWNVITSPLN